MTSDVLVRRIVSTEDDHLGAALDLHERLFDEAVRDSSEDIRRWVGEMEAARRDGTHLSLDEFLLVATRKSETLAYLFAQYYISSRYLFISYLGVDKTKREARAQGARTLLDALVDEIRCVHPDCRGLVSELEFGKARPLKILYRRHARRLGLRAYQVCVDYTQPRLSPHSDAARSSQVLLFIPLDLQSKSTLSKGEALSILRFILLEVYGDSFQHDPRLNDAYRSQLQATFAEFERTLPSTVPLLPI